MKLSQSRWHLYWIAVFAVNLIMPLFFARALTENGGRWGMALAIIVALSLGHIAIYLNKNMGFILVTGGLLVGLMQLWPMPQMIAGAMSMAMVSKMGPVLSQGNRSGYPEQLTEFGGFVATMTTAGQLMAFAVLCGFAIWLYRRPPIRGAEQETIL